MKFAARLAVLLTGSVLAASPLKAQQVADYRFEEGGGSSITNSVNSTVEGSTNATFSTNVASAIVPQSGAANNYSLSFNGGQSATFNSAPFIFNNNFGNATLQFYVYVPVSNTNNVNGSSIFWTRLDNSDTNRFNIEVQPDGSFGVDYRDPSGNLHSLVGASDAITLGEWNHLAVVRVVDSPTEDTYTLYNGTTLLATGNDFNPNLPNDTGWSISGRSGYGFDGLIDEVHFTSSALSTSQFDSSLSDTPEPGSYLLLSGLGSSAACILLRRRYQRTGRV